MPTYLPTSTALGFRNIDGRVIVCFFVQTYKKFISVFCRAFHGLGITDQVGSGRVGSGRVGSGRVGSGLGVPSQQDLTRPVIFETLLTRPAGRITAP